MTSIGHNSGQVDDKVLTNFIERVELINTNIKDEQDDRKAVMVEAKSQGLDVKTIRAVIRERAKDAEKRQEERDLLDVYLSAMGLL